MPVMEIVRKNKKYKPFLCVLIYRGLRAGLSEGDMCRELGISAQSLFEWKKKYKEVRDTIALAKKEKTEGESFPDWVYSRLSPQLQKIWDKIESIENEPNGVSKIEMMLVDNGQRVRQQLFLHALCVNSFSFSEALRKVNITRRELNKWINTDPGFAELVEEMQWHKSNFFEQRLVDLARDGNQAAIIFGNRTLNSDRGYKSKDSLDVNVKGNLTVGVLDLSLLLPYLTQTAKMELLDAVRRYEEDQSKLTPVPAQRSVEEKLGMEIANVEYKEVESA